jgi:hypothetical protein
LPATRSTPRPTILADRFAADAVARIDCDFAPLQLPNGGVRESRTRVPVEVIAVALLAGWTPTRREASTDPVCLHLDAKIARQ